MVNSWKVLSSPYGDWQLVDEFSRKSDALFYVKCCHDGTPYKSTKISSGQYEYGRYLIIKSDAFEEVYGGSNEEYTQG